MAQNPLYPQAAPEPETRENALCFSGHRPERLPQGAVLAGLLDTLHYYICAAVEQGYTRFYTGLADGIDYYAADILFGLRVHDPRIRVIGIQPCRFGYDKFFHSRGYSVTHLRLMQENVDELIVLPGSAFDRGIFQRRNRALVDHSSAIIAVCSEGRSGSLQTYHYAQQQGLSFCRIFPELPDGQIPSPELWPVERCGI
ncbi:MAG: DUF1273 family protein [Oscillospiraceae bacterium]|nr:DUF1273 family protein [Oscillospiraceae bacterium]